MNTSKIFLAAALLVAATISSCSDNCCTLGVNKVCEGESECSGHATWEECQTYLEGLGYNCD